MKKMKAKVRHLCIEISKLAKAMKFWSPVLEKIGFKLIMGGDKDFAGFTNGDFEIFICESKPRRAVRKAPTGKEYVVSDHVAFLLERPKNVDEMAKMLIDAGCKPLFPPEEHPEFVKGYYAASFCDPDNTVIEFYYHP
jgi:hypothetical protein